MKTLITIWALVLASGSAHASHIIDCHISKEGKPIVKGIKLNSKARRHMSNIWGPATGAKFETPDKSGAKVPVTVDVRLEGENLLAINLSRTTNGTDWTTIGSQRTVISSTRPIEVRMNTPNDLNLSVTCKRN